MVDEEERTSARPEQPLPRLASVAGLALAITSAFPWTPDGLTFLDLLRGEFSRGVLEGLLMLIGFGSPFLFGLTVAITPLVLPSATAGRIVRVPIAFIHSQLVLVMIVLAFAGAGIATLPMLGFALVSGVFLAVHTARTHAEAGGPRLGWYVRWGAMMVAAITAWMELQQAVGLAFGWGLHVALACSVSMIATLGGRRLRDAAPAQPDTQRGSTLF